jgi:hypothetical protein
MGNYVFYNSFDDVVSEYNKTVPIRGARKAEDLRPLGQRRKWWERIIKVNENTYVLDDGGWAWQRGALYPESVLKFSPIVWERRADGDYITPHNNLNGSGSYSRYNFLMRYTPRGLDFTYNRDGKHYVRTKDYEKHFIPKSKVNFSKSVPEIVEYNCVTFKHEGGDKFTRANPKHLLKTRRWDKPLVKEYEPKIKAMWDWAQIVLPVLHLDWETRSIYSQQLHDGYNYYNWKRCIDLKLVRDILDNEEHESRVALAVMACYELFTTQDYRLQIDEKKYADFRNLLREIGGMREYELA